MPSPGPAPAGQSNLPIIIGIVVVVALIATVATVLLVVRSDKAEAGEIFLEPAAEPGPNPFTTEIKVDPVPTTTIVKPTGTTPGTTRGTTRGTSRSGTSAPPTTAPGTTTTIPSGATAVKTSSGGTPGLYGGTQDNGRCDKAQLATFLEANQDKARAFVEALNVDTTLQWSGGNKVQVNQIRQYIDELTPVTLVADTRVTNHGFQNGKPTPRQAVLQAGTAVLIDKQGVPRSKCACGNPLTPPVAVPTTPTYTGNPWPAWNPSNVTVVQQNATPINNFVLTNLDGGDFIVRPSGSVGAEDTLTPDPTVVEPPRSTTSTTRSGGSGTTTTTRRSTTTTGPSVSIPVRATGDFCRDLQSFLDWTESQSDITEVDELMQVFLAQFAHLTEEAPDEIKDDMEYFNELVQDWDNLTRDFQDDPEYQRHTKAVEEYALRVCGIDLNA